MLLREERSEERPGCLTSHRGLSYWEPVAFPTSFLSSQEILAADSPQDLLSLFAERVFDCFWGCWEVGGRDFCGAWWRRVRCRLGGAVKCICCVCVQARGRIRAGVWGMVVDVRDVLPRLCWCPSHPQLLSAAPPRFLAPKSCELGQFGLFPSSLPLAEQWKHPV